MLNRLEEVFDCLLIRGVELSLSVGVLCGSGSKAVYAPVSVFLFVSVSAFVTGHFVSTPPITHAFKVYFVCSAR